MSVNEMGIAVSPSGYGRDEAHRRQESAARIGFAVVGGWLRGLRRISGRGAALRLRIARRLVFLHLDDAALGDASMRELIGGPRRAALAKFARYRMRRQESAS